MDKLGNYQLIRLLGEGAFAQVYLGEHIYLSTKAAIKVLRTQLISDNVEMFRTEARTIAGLIHPNILRVLDYGVEGDIPFLVLDYAPNGTLRQRHPKGKAVPLSTVISYMKQVAEALQYAHDEKLIHRDVKPENMLLGRRNEVLLSDFGVALMVQSLRFESLQNVAGTVSYMAPEQIQGKPRPASDQYSLGMVAYEWLSGELPFYGSFTEVISQQLAVPPVPLRGKISMLSPAVEQVVMRALEKDPNRRFGSVREFALALEQVGQADVLTPEQAGTPVVPQVDEAPSLTRVVTSSPEKQTIVSMVNEPTLPPTPLSSPPVQSELVGTIICSYRGHLTPVRSLSWSPDGRQIVSAGDEKTVHVWDARTGTNVHLYPDASDAVRVVAWSPDGLRITTAGGDALVRVWDVTTNGLISIYRGHLGDAVNAIGWSPKQQFLASAGNDGTVHVWDSTVGQPISIYRRHSGSVDTLAWTFDGKRIVSGGSDTSVQIWEALTGRNVSIYRGQSTKVLSVASSPNVPSLSFGSRVACGREDGTVQMWDTPIDREVLTYRYTAPVSVVAWSTDGRCFAFASGDKTIQVWNTMTNGKLFTFHHTTPVCVMAWSPDGKYIASGGGDGMIQVWIAP